MINIYGYVRVSAKDQNEDRQLVVMRELDIPEKNIFIDKCLVRILIVQCTSE